MAVGHEYSDGHRFRMRASALVAVAALAAVVVAGCGGDENDPGASAAEGSKDPIVIGLATAQSGYIAAYDVPADVGIKIAIDDLNADGGVLGRELTTVAADSRSEIQESGTAGLNVLQEGADAVVPTCDYDIGGPAAAAAQDAGVIAMASCTGSTKMGPEGIGRLAFTMSGAATSMGAIMAEWAYEKKDWREAYVLEDPTIDYSKQHCAGFRERWTELGGTIGGEDTIKQDDTSIAPQITRMKSSDEPSFIMLCSYLPGLARVAKQIRGAGIETPLIAEASFDGEDWKKAVPDLSDTYFVTYASIYGDDPEPKVNEFYDDYRDVTGEEPATSYPVLGYSLVEALARAMDRAKTTDGEKVADELEKFSDEPLLVGPTTFDAEFHISLKRPMRIMSITDGKTKFEETWAPESVPLPKT